MRHLLRTLELVLALAAALFAWAAVAKAQDLCYVDQNGITAMLGTPGRTGGFPPVHGTGAWGDDGIFYELIGQCPSSGPEVAPKMPQPSAGPLVIAWWKWYWTDPTAALHRCFKLPPGVLLPPIPPDSAIHPCAKPSAGCIPFHASSGVFAPRVFSCSGTPAPTVAVSKTPARTVTAVRTPSRVPTASTCCDPNAGPCPKGAPLCHPPTQTSIPSRTPTARPPTRTTTNTPGQPTPAPAKTASPKSTAIPPSPSPPPASPTPNSTPTPGSSCWFCSCVPKPTPKPVS